MPMTSTVSTRCGGVEDGGVGDACCAKLALLTTPAMAIAIDAERSVLRAIDCGRDRSFIVLIVVEMDDVGVMDVRGGAG